MIRGLQKQIIQLSTPQNKYFEVVFFVLRPTRTKQTPNESEMLREAKRILAQSAPQKRGAFSLFTRRPGGLSPL